MLFALDSKDITKGLSFTELLVAVAIVGILTTIATVSYNAIRQSSGNTWAKAEIAEIAKLMQMTKASDGYYHQFIYAMGYRPEETLYATVGTDASNTTICLQQVS